MAQPSHSRYFAQYTFCDAIAAVRQEVRLPQWVHFQPSSAGFARLERTFCQRPFYEYGLAVAVDGCNVTGFSLFEYEMSGKWLELLRQIAPRVTRAAVLRASTQPTGMRVLRILTLP